MPNILKELKLTELSLVDRPANPEALAPVFKACSQKGDEQMEDTFKMSDKMRERMKYYMEEKGMSEEAARKACMSEMEKAWDLITENERLRKGLIDNGYVIKAESIEKKAPEEFIDIDGEQINKADVPAPILKKLEEAEVAKAEAILEKRAQEELPHFDKEVAKELLKFDLDDKVLEALKAADAAFDHVMSEAGEASVNSDMEDPSDKLDQMVKAYKEEKKTTYEKAYSEVIKTAEGKALVKELYKKED